MSALLALPMTAAHAAPALPTGGQYVAGAGTIAATGANGLQVTQQGARGIIDWRSFNIGQGGTVSINNGNGATLNRVTGGQLSTIQGTLSATGSIYLVNPQGVVVGPNGQVLSGGSVVMSTRNINNDAFMAGGAMTASGTSVGDVTNKGTVVARQGDVVIIGQNVNNAGTVSAVNGTATLAAGNTVVLAPVGGSSGVVVSADPGATGSVTNSGTITAAAAALTAAGGNVYSLAGNTGLIQATGTATIDGHVFLTAPNGMVSVSGNIIAKNADGSGGTIIVNGRQVSIGSTARLDATGLYGGRVLIGVSAPQTDLADSTVIADGATILAGGPGGGGSIETSGHTIKIGSATISAGQGGSWLLDPTDLTIDATLAATINNSLATTDVTQTASNDLTVAPGGDLNWTSTHILTLNSGNNMTITAGITGTNGTLNLNNATNLVVGTAELNIFNPISVGTLNISAGNTLNFRTGGNITVGGTLTTASVSGTNLFAGVALTANAVSMNAQYYQYTMAAGSTVHGNTGVVIGTGEAFVNNSGASAITVGAGRYLIYSKDPTKDTTGGLTNNFIQYSANFGDTALGTGNGFLYSLAPVLNYSLMGSTTKVYDGTTAVTTTLTSASNLNATGLQAGDTVAIMNPSSAVFTTANVGTSLTVTIPGVSITHTGGLPVYGYAVGQQNLSGVIGSITPKAASITGGVVANNKTYDGTGTGTLTIGTIGLTGVVAADVGNSAKLGVDSSGATATFVSNNVGNGIAVTAAGFVLNGSSQNNYTLTQPTGLTANIGKATLTAVGISAADKTYDHTTNATLGYTNASLSGLASGDVGAVTLNTGGVTAAFSTANVGNGLTVNISGLAIAGAQSGNYTITPTAIAHASISAAPLTISGLSAGTKAYDGTTTASLTGGALSGVVSGDGANVTLNNAGVTATFSQANAGNGIGVTVTGFTLNGTSAGNYALTQPTGLTATISPVALTLGLNDAYTKTYDGTLAATITDFTKFSLTGFIGGNSATVNQVLSANFNTAGAGTGKTLTANLVTSDYTAVGGTVLSNYVLPTSVTNAGTAQITQAPLVITIVGNPQRTFTTTGDTSVPALSAANFLVQGFATGQSATINQPTGTFASGASGTEAISAAIASGNFANATGGFSLANYSFPTTANGFGTINPAGTILVTFTAQVKTYDGLASISIPSSAFTVTGLNPGDTAKIDSLDTSHILAGLFATPNAGIQPISVSLANTGANANGGNFGNYVSTGGSLVGYTLPTSAAGQGTINAKALTAAIISTSLVKTYDGSTLINLGSGAYQLTGFVGSDGATVTQTVANFASANASTGTNTSALSAVLQAPNLAAFVTPNPGTLLSNYILPSTASGVGTINKAPLTVVNAFGVDRVYNATTAAALNTTGAGLSGLITGDTVTLTSPSTGVFSSANVGTGVSISTGANPFTLGGSSASNYTLTQPTGLVANITAAPLTTNVVANNKVYDGTTVATLGGLTLNGVFASDNANVSLNSSGVTPVFTQSDAGVGIAVTATGFTLTGTAAGNYKLTVPAHLTANITPAQLSGSIINNPTKIYNGTTGIILGSSNFSITGWVAGQGGDVTIVPTAALDSYTSANVLGSTLSTAQATLAFSNFVATGATKLSNYYLPGGPSQVTGTVSGAATITPAPLIAQIIGNPTRVYDGATDTNNVNGVNGLQSANYALLGFYGSDGATIANNLAGVFNTRHVGTDTITVSGLIPANYTATGGAILSNYSLPTTATGGGTITPFALTITGVTAQDKVYENSPFATLNTGSAVLNGVFAIDAGLGITFNAGNGAFNDKTANPSKTVTASGFSLNNSTNDYILTQPLVPNAAITKAPLNLDVTKAYDGTNSANATIAGIVYSNLTGIYNGDIVSLGSTTGITGTFSSKDVNAVAANQAMTLAGGTLNGSDAGNYQIATGAGTITPATLTITGATALNKTYNAGNTSATIDNTNAQLSGLFSIDNGVVTLNPGPTTGTFASGNAGMNIVVTPTIPYSIAGNTQGNYTLTQPSLSATIYAAGVNLISVASVQKVYDGTTALPSTINLANFFTLSGVTGGDQVSVSSATGSYASANVGTGIGITIVNGSVQLTGAQAANYAVNNLPANSLIGIITAKPLTVTLGAKTKVYDGTTGIALTTTDFGLSGFVAGQGATVTQTVGNYANANVLGAAASTINAGLATTNFSGTGGFVATNYSIGGVAISASPITVSNTASTITPLTLGAGFSPVTKPYDGNNSAANLLSGFFASGFIGTTNTASLSNVPTSANTGALYTAIAAAYNAGTGYTVTSGSLSGATFALPSGASGTTADYVLPSVATNLASVITKRTLTAGFGATTKVYDGTLTSAALSGFVLGNFVGSDAGTLTNAPTTANYLNADVQTGTTLTASLSGSGFTTSVGLAANYQLPTNATGSGSITAKTLGASFNPITKAYDGTGSAAGLLGTLFANGFVGTTNTSNLTGVPSSANANAAYVAIGGLYNVGTNYTVNSGTITGAAFTLPSGALGILADYTLPTFASATGNAITAASLGLINVASVHKVYDGTTALPGTIDLSNFYTLSGVVAGDNVSIASASGSYASPNVGTGIGITIVNGSVVLTGAQAGNYTVNNLAPGSLIGVITPRLLTVTLGPKTKVYDSTTGIALLASDFGLSGFVSGQSTTLNQTVGAYASKDVLGAARSTISASLTSGNFNVGTGGFLASNYSLPASVTNTVSTITPAPLTASGVLANNKIYDGTTAATLTTSGATLVGLFSGDTVTLSSTAGAATFSDPNAANGKTVTAALSSYGLGGAQAADYTLTAINPLSANITPAPLTAVIIGNPTKIYDGTTPATLTPANFALTGFVGPDGSTITQTVGTYASPNAGSPNVSATLGGGNFSPTGSTLLSNYTLPTSATGPGQINPAQLVSTIIGTPTKPFDGGTGATLTPANFTLTGFIGPDGGTVTQTVGTYTGPTAGPQPVTALLNPSVVTLTNGTLLSNYTLPVRATGPGLITAALTTAPAATTGDVYTTIITATGVLPTPVVDAIIAAVSTPDFVLRARLAAFTVANVRTYIPYPAPGALSTWRNNGWGTLPIVVDETTDYAQTQDDNGNLAVQSGAPVINSTEQVMLSGVKNKRWRITIPQFGSGPSLTNTGAVVAGQ